MISALHWLFWVSSRLGRSKPNWVRHSLLGQKQGQKVVYDNWHGTRHSHMTSHHKLRCHEYLRQSIIYNADTNIEYRVVSESGAKEIPGWDVKRCRNFGTFPNGLKSGEHSMAKFQARSKTSKIQTFFAVESNQQLLVSHCKPLCQ